MQQARLPHPTQKKEFKFLKKVLQTAMPIVIPARMHGQHNPMRTSVFFFKGKSLTFISDE
jgi:hypothetical protein